jgi:hypothetical protein
VARFVGIPALPEQGVEEDVLLLLEAYKENIELLCGIRGESDGASRAITKSQLTVATPPSQVLTAVTARGSGVSVSGAQVPILADYIALVQDVQNLANDVARLRAVVETLLVQLRG